MTMLGRKVGIAIEGEVIRTCTRLGGKVVTMPACIVRNARLGSARHYVGADALMRHAEDPESWEIHWPLLGTEHHDRDGVYQLLREVVIRSLGRGRVFRPEVICAVAADVSGSARRQLLQVFSSFGTRTAYLVDLPVAHMLALQKSHAHLSRYVLLDCQRTRMDCSLIADGFVIAHASSLGDESVTAGGAETGAKISDRLHALISDVQNVSPHELWDEAYAHGVVLTGTAAEEKALQEKVSALPGIALHLTADPEFHAVRGVTQAIDDWNAIKRAYVYIK